MYIHIITHCQFKRVGKPTRSRNPTLPFVGFFYQRCHLWTGLSLNTSNFFTTNRCTNKMYLSAERISKFINLIFLSIVWYAHIIYCMTFIFIFIMSININYLIKITPPFIIFFSISIIISVANRSSITK